MAKVVHEFRANSINLHAVDKYRSFGETKPKVWELRLSYREAKQIRDRLNIILADIETLCKSVGQNPYKKAKIYKFSSREESK